jgi:hypothetical protein
VEGLMDLGLLFGDIEEIEHQVDLENLQQEEAHLRAQKQA